MNIGKNTVKTLMHYSSSLLAIIEFILSLVLFFLLPSDSEASNNVFMIVITASLYLILSVAIFITGNLVPTIDQTVFPARFFTGILTLLKDIPIHGLHITGSKSTKSARGNWNARSIFTLNIFLVSASYITIGLAVCPDFRNPVHMIRYTIAYPYGVILVAQPLLWTLLFITAFIWNYIDTASRIQVPKDYHSLKQKDNKKPLVQCSSCAAVFQYNQHDGICPKCGNYNRLSESTYRIDKSYKQKKMRLKLFKTYGAVILSFAITFTLSIIRNSQEAKDDIANKDIKVPAVSRDSKIEDTGEISDGTAFTPEDIGALLEEIKADNGYKTIYHKELYKDGLTDEDGNKCNEVTILIATDNSEKVSWFKFNKYLKTSKDHKAGEIVFYMGAESDSLKKSDIIDD